MAELPPEEKKDVDLDKPAEFLENIENVPDKKLEEDAKDPIIGSGASNSFKEFVKGRALNLKKSFAPNEFDRGAFVLGSSMAVGACKSLMEFTKRLIQKRGNISFSEGFKIGSEDKNSKK